MTNVTSDRKMQEYISKIDFSLNFEDKTPSVKISKGDSLFYDGYTVVYSKKEGKFEGKTPHLKSAVGSWLILKEEKSNFSNSFEESKEKREEYDGLKGGSFDKWSEKQAGFDTRVINEQEQTVKKLDSQKKEDKKPNKLELAGDQIEVKKIAEDLLVNSSTVTPREKKYSTEVKEAEDYGADSTTPLKREKKEEKKSKNNNYTVNDMTPSVPSEATTEEVQKAKRVINADESQDAKVVNKIRKAPEVKSVEGVTLKKTESSKEIDTSVKVSSGGNDTTIDASAKVSSGGNTPVVDMTEEKRAQDSEKKENDNNYINKLPDDWGKMHWTQKEKFIKELEDIDFIKFIMGVETIKAVQKACKTRLETLE